MQLEEILKKLKSLSKPENIAGMIRFGINPKNTYGVSIPDLRKIAKEIDKDHQLAQKLWNTGIHEAKILASMIDYPEMVTEKQMDLWVNDFDSWDVCDQVCMNLFDKTKFVQNKAIEWSSNDSEFIKKAAFTLMATSAVHLKDKKDEHFLKFLSIIKREATDNRNYVKKSINWALRQIGKRNIKLNEAAIKTAKEIQKIDSKTAKWIASDTLRELNSDAVQKRLRR
jgi:3-methyladenine DNA glycosylase AlkD